jgi:hypothetical protein
VERYRARLFGGNARRGKVEAAGARKSGDLLQTQRPANVDKGTFLRNPLKSVPGVKETPRSTSPNLAPVTSMNGVIAANDGSVFAALSTTTRSLSVLYLHFVYLVGAVSKRAVIERCNEGHKVVPMARAAVRACTVAWKGDGPRLKPPQDSHPKCGLGHMQIKSVWRIDERLCLVHLNQHDQARSWKTVRQRDSAILHPEP